MQRSLVNEHVQNTIANFRIDIQTKCKNECHTMKDAFEELRNEYCSETPRYVILERADVSKNAIRRASSDSHYKGLRELGCIRLALALGVKEMYDIDYLLNARGFAGLSDCNREDYIRWRGAVEIVLKLHKEFEDDFLPEDMVFTFKELFEV